MIIRALDKDHGFFLSHSTNHIHASTDGGKTWTPHELGNGADTDVYAMQFLDTKTGYVLCGTDYHVRQTTDSGKRWHSLGSLRRPVQDRVKGLFFTPNGTGYVVGAKGYIARYGK